MSGSTFGRLLLSSLVLAASLALPRSAAAQELTPGTRGPRFLLASPAAEGGLVPLDVSRTPALRRRIAVDLDGVTLKEALATIAKRAGLELAYAEGVVPLGSRVRLRADEIPVAAALTAVLVDVNVDVVFTPEGRAILKRREGAVAVRAGTIVGRVTDAKTGEELARADVALEGTRWRAATGEDGRYRLSGVEAGSYTLVIRRIGYGRQTRAVTVSDGQDVAVDVAMEAIPTQLDEVVTTVTGEQRLRELGHVVGRINADSLVKEAPVSTLSELLNGRVPGLQVFQSQGTVGGEVHLQVRGPNSLLLNTEPIVIVDGIRYASGASQRPNVGSFALRDVEPTSPLNDLNPSDIETIEVVKGPSAATLYGTDAANGVLVITTKRGRPGPAHWNAYARGAVTEIPEQRYPDLYWGWGTVNGVPSNPGFNCSLLFLAWGLCTQQDSISVVPNPLNDPEYTVLGRKPSWEYGLNVAGGRQDVRYYFSADFDDATGPVQMPSAIAEQLKQQRGLSELPEEWREPNSRSAVNLRANVTALFGERAELRVTTGYVRSASRTLGLGYFQSPYTGGVFGSTPGAPYGPLSSNNPAQSFLRTSTERTDRFFGTANGQWRPASWLQARATVGLDLGTRNRYNLARRGDVPTVFPNGAVLDERARQVATSADLGATATFRWGRVMSRTSVGTQYVRTLDDVLASTGDDLPPGGSSIGEAATVRSGQSYSEAVKLGSYLEQTVGVNDRLFVTGALRIDGASTFGRDYDAAVFQKASVSWIVSEESFLPRLPGVEELRLRYAYGTSAQEPRPEWGPPSFGPLPTVAGGTRRTAVHLTTLGNPNLRPERTREHEFGVDIAALAQRMQVGLTWYRRRTVDQIVSTDLAPGMGSTYANLGLSTQHGFEAELTARVLDTRALSWDVTLQHSLQRSKLIDRGDAQGSCWLEGYPLGSRCKYTILNYADANGDGIIADSEVEVDFTPVYAGVGLPPRSQTLTTVFGLFERRFRLSALMERRTGFVRYDYLQEVYCGTACRAGVDRTASFAEQASAVTPWAGQYNTPGDFTRLREVTAALELPTSLTRALGVRQATLALSGRNLALWTDFSGPDPESARVREGGVVGGADGIPQGRSWSLRVDLGL